MRQNKGYIRLHRNIVDWCWYKNANTFRVFIHLLLNANIKPHKFVNVIIKRGEIATSYDKIAGELNLSYKQVRTAIEHIVRAGTGAVKQYPKFLVITVLNYNAYQSDGQSNGQANGHPKGRQRAGKGQQSKNEKNEKNEKEYIALSGEPEFDVDRYNF